MITATRHHDLCAGHRVVGQGGKCEHLHGHNYRIHFICTPTDGALDVVGRVLDFGEIGRRLCQWLELEWDHKFLIWDDDPWGKDLKRIDPNVVLVPFNPTAELMAEHLVLEIGPEALKGTGAELVECVVEETRKCSAKFGLKGFYDQTA